MRTGLLGGTFNPIHNAHLQVAETALAACRLDRVIFVPAADPPHKALAGDVPFALRARMVSLAIANREHFELSTVEGERGGKSYSIDTLDAFHRQAPRDELFFIIGGDSFVEIGQWHRYADIFRACNLIVVERPGYEIAHPHEVLPVAVRSEFRYDDDSRRLIHESGRVVYCVRGTPRDISSTEIRRLCAAGSRVDHLVPPVVAAYISQQRIYSACP